MLLQYFIKKKLKMKLIFSIQINIKISYKFVSTLLLQSFLQVWDYHY